MKQKIGILDKIHGVLTAVFSASLVSLKGQKSLSFSGFSGGGGGKNPSSKNKPSEPHLSPSKTTPFFDQNRQSQDRADTKKTRRYFFKFSLNTTFLLVLSKLFYKAFRGSNYKQAKFNPNPTAPKDVFKLLKEVKAHTKNPDNIVDTEHVKNMPCGDNVWPTVAWPAYPTSPCRSRFTTGGRRYDTCTSSLSASKTVPATNPPCPDGHRTCVLHSKKTSWRQFAYTTLYGYTPNAWNRWETNEARCKH